MSLTDDLPRLTAELPGISGRLKTVPEDFVVEEIPAFEPSGDGEHRYLWIEKRDVSHEQLLRHLASALSIRTRDIGTAGMKDKAAVTRQWVSVPAKPQAAGAALVDSDEIRVLRESRHPHKLRTGKLRGNRFEILVRDVVRGSPDPAPPTTAGLPQPTANLAIQVATAIADRINQTGFPNYFGPQRFGRDGSTLQTGLRLLRGEITPDDLPRARKRFLLRLALNAAQSYVFNKALARRIDEGLFATVLPGDVMRVTSSGGLFVAEDANVEQQRLDSGEIAVTGPIFGPKMRQPSGEVAERERQLVDELGIGIEAWSQFRKLTSGTRRPYGVLPGDLSIERDESGLRFRFTLTAGSYATVLLREFLRDSDAV